MLDPDRGLAQRIEQYRGVDEAGRGTTGGGRQRRADSVMDDAIRWLDNIQGYPLLLVGDLYRPASAL